MLTFLHFLPFLFLALSLFSDYFVLPTIVFGILALGDQISSTIEHRRSVDRI
jgi:hypothetical protein